MLVYSPCDMCRVTFTLQKFQWLRANGLLANQMVCGNCGVLMQGKCYSRSVDGITWRCTIC
jgi:hypothetical protein